MTPLLPVAQQPEVIGMDFASGPDQAVTRLLQVQNGLIREIHRVTGIPRYQLGLDGVERDTWQDQVDAGLSEIIKTES
ncbi:MAG: hypothetical protein AAFR68_04185 [Pseudomonadota bacterium]